MKHLHVIRINGDDVKCLKGGEILQLKEDLILEWDRKVPARPRHPRGSYTKKADRLHAVATPTGFACGACGKPLKNKNALGPHKKACPGIKKGTKP